MRIKPLAAVEDIDNQVTFILTASAALSNNAQENLEVARARHNALVEELKKKVQNEKSKAFYSLLLIDKIAKDVVAVATMRDRLIDEKKVPVDIAHLCKEVVVSEKDFAQSFLVSLEFSLPDFGQKDIEPLITPLFKIAPEKFTGPFFTAQSEVKYFTVAIQKLLEIGTLIAVRENPLVKLSVTRHENSFFITISVPTSKFVLDKQSELFVMYYGGLAEKTSLGLGSGLEGYIAKKIIDSLHIPMKIVWDDTSGNLSFQLEIHKEKK